MSKPTPRATVLNTFGVVCVDYLGVKLWCVNLLCLTPNKNRLQEQLIFLTQDEALNIKPGYKYIR